MNNSGGGGNLKLLFLFVLFGIGVFNLLLILGFVEFIILSGVIGCEFVLVMEFVFVEFFSVGVIGLIILRLL